MRSTSEQEKIELEEQKRLNQHISKEKTKSWTWPAQIVLLIALITLFLLSFKFPNMMTYAKMVLVVELIIMAYNNKMYFKRKNASVIYIAVAIFFTIDIIIGFLYNG